MKNERVMSRGVDTEKYTPDDAFNVSSTDAPQFVQNFEVLTIFVPQVLQYISLIYYFSNGSSFINWSMSSFE